MLKSVCFGLIILIGGALPGIGQEQPFPKELIQYIRDAKKVGLPDAQIQQNAVIAGWNAAAVKEALESLGGTPKPATATGVKEQEPPKSEAPAQAVKPAFEQPSTASAPQRAGGETPAASATPAGNDGGSAPKAIQRNVPEEYRIGEGDVIQVSVWGEREASVGSVVVRPDGMITMPLLKDVRVAGLTPGEAEKVIAEPLSKLIKTADVTVIINQINSKKIFMVGGGIKKEGPLPYTYRMTVMQAISEAGGMTDYAKRKKIYVLRNENGRQFKLPFDYDAVLNGKRMEMNHILLPGDTLVVPNH